MTRLKALRAFTLIELMVVIAIIAILAALLFPVFAHAKESSRHIGSISITRQVCFALQIYLQDNNERFPAACFNEAYVGPHPTGRVAEPIALYQTLLPDVLLGHGGDASIFYEPTMPSVKPRYYAPAQKYVASGPFNYMCGHGPRQHPLLQLMVKDAKGDPRDGMDMFVCGRTSASITEPTQTAAVFRDSFAVDPVRNPYWEPTVLPPWLGGAGEEGVVLVGFADGHVHSTQGKFADLLLMLGIHLKEQP